MPIAAISLVPDWSGVCNGEEFSPTQKARARSRQTLPYAAHLRLITLLGHEDAAIFAASWMQGWMDARVQDGEAEFTLTADQKIAWEFAGMLQRSVF